MKHFITTSQFNSAEQLTDFLSNVPSKTDPYGAIFTDKIMASLFLEPSTRTRFSFESMMYRAGGSVLSESEDGLSIAKGETLEDTIKSISNFCDVIVLRHPDVGAAQRATAVTDTPVINAGDGSGEHPTQALLDMYTIYQQFDSLDKLKVLFCGDLKNSRTVHSLIILLNLYPNIQIITTNPKKLDLPSDKYTKYDNLSSALDQKPDVVYMTRLQKERIDDKIDLDKLHKDYKWGDFTLTPDLLGKLKDDAIVMHPLPRNSEIHVDCDKDKRCVYFTSQIKNGLKVRMALFFDIFNGKVCYDCL